MDDLEQIQHHKHIVIIANNETFPLANALYSYILTLHKKVSLTMTEEVDKKFGFLPWFDKVRLQIPSSYDYKIELSENHYEIYQWFEEHGVKINVKMATAFYSAFLLDPEQNHKVLYELDELGAQKDICIKYLKESEPLCLFRLRAYMFERFVLENSAQTLKAYVNDEMLGKSGASVRDAHVVAKELLNMVHVNKVVLVQEDTNKILDEIKERK